MHNQGRFANQINQNIRSKVIFIPRLPETSSISSPGWLNRNLSPLLPPLPEKHLDSQYRSLDFVPPGDYLKIRQYEINF